MDIIIRLAFHEHGALRLLNYLAYENAIIFVQRPELPNLYDSRVRYRREKREIWSDVLNTLRAGHEDCDALSAWRAGELIARGADALLPFDDGYKEARREKLTHIAADCIFKTPSDKKNPGGLYHCITRYWVGKNQYYDDPSARLGMNGRWDPDVVTHRRRLGTWHD